MGIQHERETAAVLIRPRYYSNGNALAATGFAPRALRTLAQRYGVKVRKAGEGRRWFIDADEFDAAVRAQAAADANAAKDPQTSVDALIAELGLTRRTP